MDQLAFTVRWPGKILFGAGQLANLGEEARLLGRHAFLSTTPELTTLGLTDRVLSLLEAAEVRVTPFVDVQPDPTCLGVDEAARVARAAGCDLVVGVGGGSAIDFAKGVAVAATHAGLVWDYVTYTGANAKPVTEAVLPVMAIPTTAGTGSEVSMGTVLDNPETHMKAALLSPHIYPRLALVDPELTYTMPPGVTSMTGFDALTHGLEAYLNAARSNPASDLFAQEAARLAAGYLPKVVTDGGDLEARARMSWAATLGGISIALSNTTVAHAMALPLGARLGTPHGLGLSRLLPAVVAASWQVQPERYAALADVVGASQPGMTTIDQAQSLAGWLESLVDKIGLAARWSSQGMDSAVLDTLTSDVLAYMGRPVQQHRPVFTWAEIRQLYQTALTGA